MMKEALETGLSENGNHKIEFSQGWDGDLVFTVYYRGTVIADVEMRPDNNFKYCPVGAGEFENTPATIRQRKELQEAIMELQMAIDNSYIQAVV